MTVNKILTAGILSAGFVCSFVGGLEQLSKQKHPLEHLIPSIYNLRGLLFLSPTIHAQQQSYRLVQHKHTPFAVVAPDVCCHVIQIHHKGRTVDESGRCLVVFLLCKDLN